MFTDINIFVFFSYSEGLRPGNYTCQLGVSSASEGLAFDFRALEGLDDFGDDVDLAFFRFCFFSPFGSSVSGESSTIPSAGWPDSDCSESTRNHPK